MKNSRISLRLDDPCTQKWAELTPSEKGRFCNSCAKDVIDVTHLTDNEILKLIADHPNGFCGQFRSSQLNRAFVQTKLNGGSKRLNAFVAGVMIALGAGSASAQSTTSATVQTQVIDEKHPTGPVCIRETAKDIVAQEVHVMVMDTAEGIALKGAVVSIPGTNITAITDSTGKATLRIPSYVKNDSIQISIQCRGYLNNTISFVPSSTSETVKAALAPFEYIMLGGPMYIQVDDEPKDSSKK